MNSQALIMMVFTELIVTGFTVYFFWRVLNTKPKPNDSYTDDDKV